MRPKHYKEDIRRKREIQNENDHLVLKILKIREGRSERIPSQMRGSTMSAGRNKSASQLSARSHRSQRSGGSVKQSPAPGGRFHQKRSSSLSNKNIATVNIGNITVQRDLSHLNSIRKIASLNY